MTTTKYNNEEFKVDEQTLDIYHNGSILKPAFLKRPNRWFVSYVDRKGKSHIAPRARIICMAFHPHKNYKRLQTDHIDSDPTNDSPDNLRWTTRKQNNSTEHASAMKRQNKRRTSHINEVIKAVNVNSGEVRWFANGHHAAQCLKCSHPLVYMALDKNSTVRAAKKWRLEWTNELSHEDIEQMKAQRKKDVAEAGGDASKKRLEKNN